VDGIGENTVNKLMKEFKTIGKIELAATTELEALIGKSKTKIVTDYFKQKKEAD
jgi:excinuclease ABC subunit C